MPITVTCGCGKRLTVGDAMAGKTLRCPTCGNAVLVSAAPQAAGAKPKKSVNPKVTVSPATIIYVVVAAALVTCGALFYFGPMRVWNQWEEIGSKAEDDVSSVLAFALQAYLSEQGDYDPSKAHGMPQVDGKDIQFQRPFLAMSMPEKVKFVGKSNQGDFSGYYHPGTGEIDADVEFGGYAFAGQVNIRKATGSFHMTGRVRDKQPQVEVNGKSAQIRYREKGDE
jgi:DNA-directed RNA polymerase subunit RPC12/RpoP